MQDRLFGKRTVVHLINFVGKRTVVLLNPSFKNLHLVPLNPTSLTRSLIARAFSAVFQTNISKKNSTSGWYYCIIVKPHRKNSVSATGGQPAV